MSPISLEMIKELQKNLLEAKTDWEKYDYNQILNNRHLSDLGVGFISMNRNEELIHDRDEHILPKL